MSDVAWAYVAGGAGRQRTVQANRDAFDRHRIVPRMLVDVEHRDTSVELFGRRLPAPLLFAPIGVLELAHRDADHAVARAARALDLPMVISSQASVPMEDVARTLGDAPRWFQLYWSKDDDVVDSFVSRAEAIGSEALVVTLDTHVLGWRTRDLDLAYLPFARGEGIAQYTSDPAFRRLVEARAAVRRGRLPRPTPAAVRALHSMARHYPGRTRDNLRSPLPRAAVETFLDVFSRSSLTWADLARLRERTSLPIVLKGIQHPGDAALALEHGVDGIVVSNHGGRQVDGAIGSLDALPAVVEVVGGRIPVLFDSGIRSGADVVTALALGARPCSSGGRGSTAWPSPGADGARAVMQHLWAELDLTMALSGVRSVDEIGPRPAGPGLSRPRADPGLPRPRHRVSVSSRASRSAGSSLGPTSAPRSERPTTTGRSSTAIPPTPRIREVSTGGSGLHWDSENRRAPHVAPA